MIRGAFAVACAGVVAYALRALSTDESSFSLWWDGVVYHVPIAMGLVSLVALVRAAPPSKRSGWALIAVAYLIWSQGSLWWKLVQQRSGRVAAFNGIDAVRLVLYPIAAYGLWRLADHPRRDRARVPTAFAASAGRRARLDSLGAALATASLCAAAARRTVIDDALRSSEALTNLVYPIGDACLLVVLVTVAAFRGWRIAISWWVLMAALVTRFVANLGYLSGASDLDTVGPAARDAIWPATAVCIAFAPHLRTRARTWAGDTTFRLAILPLLIGCAAVAAPVLDAHPIAVVLGLLALSTVLVGVVLAAQDEARLETVGAAAMTDPVTGLLNRQGLLFALEAQQGPAIVAIAEVVGLRDLNEAVGRDIGDEVLKSLGERLQRALPNGLVARLSGDEFAVAVTNHSGTAGDSVLSGDSTPSDPTFLSAVSHPSHHLSAEALCVLLATTIREPSDIPLAATLRLSSICGATRADPARTDVLEALTAADSALVTARVERLEYRVFDQELANLLERRRRFVASLRSTARPDDLLVYLQPKVVLATGAIVGAEALARWRHPDLGVLPPAKFLPLLSGTERQSFTQHMLSGVLDEIVAAQERGRPVPVALNLTASDLMDPHFASHVLQALSSRALAPSLLTVELTEEELLRDWTRGARELTKLRSGGVRVSIDDFGTGYSSLAVVHRLPFDEIKLDRTFLFDLATSEGARATLEAILRVAKMMGAEVVAEGVEGPEERDLLVELGCVYGQGYLFSRPVSPHEFHALLDLTANAAPG